VQTFGGRESKAARRTGDDGDTSREIRERWNRRDGGVCRREEGSIWPPVFTSANCATFFPVVLSDYTDEYNTMRRHWFFILLSLADQDRHGSGIMRDVLELTNDELKLWPVTLYGSLDELQEHAWIRALDKPPAGSGEEGGRKRWFRITPAGRRALAAEVARLDATVRVATRRLAHSGDPS
jgi:DNA-binding PadR family transcriptional regulator